MPYPVHYSLRAYAEYEEILAYIAEKFDIEIALKVDAYFEDIIENISINPYMFPHSDKKKDLRRCVISPQTTLYYRFDGNYIELASFRGDRMDPRSLNL